MPAHSARLRNNAVVPRASIELFHDEVDSIESLLTICAPQPPSEFTSSVFILNPSGINKAWDWQENTNSIHASVYLRYPMT